MRGLLPSKGLTQARSMALFSDALSPAVGFSGAWGSCLEWGGGGARERPPPAPRLRTSKRERKHSSPDAQVGAARVVAADRGHSAGVGADVARPGLGDVQGAVGVGAHARDGLHADGRALLLPDVPARDARPRRGAARPFHGRWERESPSRNSTV